MKNCTGILCPMQHGRVDPATCKAVDYCPQATPPRTNADRIRAMSDEELADFLHEEMMAAIVRGWKSWLDWLKQEAKE